MNKYVLITESYDKAVEFSKRQGTNINDYNVIIPSQKNNIYGLRLEPNGYKVIGDPVMPYSFFIYMQTITKGETERPQEYPIGKFKRGDRVRKKGDKGQWHGHIVGEYSATCTTIGYAVESERETGSVQIYPESALELYEGEQSITIKNHSVLLTDTDIGTIATALYDIEARNRK
jgi:hypothetical protein